MKITTLEQNLKDDDFMRSKNQQYLRYYDEAMRGDAIGTYRGRTYITLSRKTNLDQPLEIKLCRQDDLCQYHVHSWIELSYVFSGQCRMQVLDRDMILKEGQFILLNTGVPHCEGETGEGTFINIMFDRTYFDSHFFSQLAHDSCVTRFFLDALNEEKDHENYIVFHSENDERLPTLVRILLCEYYDRSICSNEIIHSCISMIFSELILCYQRSAERDEHSAGKYQIAQILRWIENHAADCTLQQTADFFGLSPNYLTSLLKKSVGRSFKQLVQETRLSNAARLLCDTDVSVREIANHVGYENMGFFNTKFREAYGMTPGEYREAKSES